VRRSPYGEAGAAGSDTPNLGVLNLQVFCMPTRWGSAHWPSGADPLQLQQLAQGEGCNTKSEVGEAYQVRQSS
jgi:hypothetical protein